MANAPDLEKFNRLLLLQTVPFWICTSTALSTSPLYRYYTRTSLLDTDVLSQRGIINEGCK